MAIDPLETFNRTQDSIYDHRETRIATNGAKVLAVGSSRPNHAHTEIFNIDDNEWFSEADYPFHSDLYGFAMVNVGDEFFVFGGFAMDGNRFDGETDIAMFSLETLGLRVEIKIIPINDISYLDITQAKNGHTKDIF